MKTIYIFTLKGIDEDVECFNNNLRVLAYMLYTSIYNYYGDNKFPLDINENIEYNELNEDCQSHVFQFDSEIYDDSEYVDYDPFLIGDNSFGITISDETFDVEIIKSLLEQNMRLLGFNYKVDMDLFKYEAKDQSDERNRQIAIKTIFNKLGCKQKRGNIFGMFNKHGKYNRRRYLVSN